MDAPPPFPRVTLWVVSILLALAVVASHWAAFTLAAFGATVRGSFRCTPSCAESHRYDAWTVVMFAPEIVLLAGGVIAVAGASTRVRVWLVTLALACAAVVGVGVSAATHPSLLEHAPPDIIFGGWR